MNTTRTRLQLSALLCCCFLFGQNHSQAQSSTGWTGASDGFWNNAANWTNGLPNTGSPATRILNFGTNGNARANSTNNMNNLSSHRFFFNDGATNYTLYLASGTVGPNLFDFGGNQPQIQNDSTNIQTIDMSLKMQATGISGAANQIANINPTKGDLVFTSNCTNAIAATYVKFFSSEGHTVSFFGPILASISATTSNNLQLATTGSGGKGATVVFYNTNGCYTNIINSGTFRMATNNVTSSPILIGDTNSATAPPAFVLMDNGFTNSSPFVILTNQPSATNSRTIGNTTFGSGTALFTGPVSLGTNLTLAANPAGMLELDGNFDFQNPAGAGRRMLTVSGTGNTILAGSLSNASTGSSVLNKTNSGTLTLAGTNNGVRVLFNHGGGVLSITNAVAIGVPTGVNYPDKFNFVTNATLSVTNSFTLGRNAGAADNAGFRIAGGSTGTFDVAANSTLTIDGPIIDIPSSGSGSLSKSSAGTLVLQQTNTYTGNTTISTGTLTLNGNGSIANSTNVSVASGAVLDASARSDGTLALSSGQNLIGSGTIIGTLAIASGSSAAPGNSTTVSTLSNTGSTLLQGSGTLVVKVQNATLGAGTGNDALAVSGNIGVQATSGNKFTVKLVSLNGSATAGNVTNFNNATSYSWTLATGTVTNFDPNAFNVDTSGFSNPLGGGQFVAGVSNGNLVLVFKPSGNVSGQGPTITNPTTDGNGHPAFSGFGIPGYTYGVESATSLSGPWIEAGNVLASGNGSWNFTDTNTVNPPIIFYRIYYPDNPGNPPQ